MTWSIRTPPAWRSAWRSMSMKAEKPLLRRPRGEKAVMPQFLAFPVDEIRRRADLEALQNLILAAPACAAGRWSVPTARSAIGRFWRRRRERLAVRRLSPGRRGIAPRRGRRLRPGFSRDETGDRGAVGVLVVGGPVPPIEAERIALGEAFGERLEDRMALQADAGVRCGILGREVGSIGLREHSAQGGELGGGGARPVDQRRDRRALGSSSAMWSTFSAARLDGA